MRFLRKLKIKDFGHYALKEFYIVLLRISEN